MRRSNDFAIVAGLVIAMPAYAQNSKTTVNFPPCASNGVAVAAALELHRSGTHTQEYHYNHYDRCAQDHYNDSAQNISPALGTHGEPVPSSPRSRRAAGGRAKAPRSAATVGENRGGGLPIRPPERAVPAQETSDADTPLPVGAPRRAGFRSASSIHVSFKTLYHSQDGLITAARRPSHPARVNGSNSPRFATSCSASRCASAEPSLANAAILSAGIASSNA